jgi:hypothetical protein
MLKGIVMNVDLLPLSVFLGFSLLLGGLFWLVNRGGDQVERRLRELVDETPKRGAPIQAVRKSESLWPNVDAALLPVNAEQRTRLETRLYLAGFYHPLALRLFVAVGNRPGSGTRIHQLSANSQSTQNVLTSFAGHLAASRSTRGASGQRREFVGERVPICMLRDSKNPVATGRYERDGDVVW